MYLDHTFACKTFAQRIGSAKVKSKSEVAHCIVLPFYSFINVLWSSVVARELTGAPMKAHNAGRSIVRRHTWARLLGSFPVQIIYRIVS